MNLKSTLKTLTLAGLVGLAGCNPDYLKPETIFDGKIEKEQIKLYRYPCGGNRVLEITKTNGSTVRYTHSFSDCYKRGTPGPHIIEIDDENGTGSAFYSHDKNESVKELFVVERQKYKDYLKKIFEAQTKPLGEKAK